MEKKELIRWKDVLENVGKDAVATVVFLYFDELAHHLGKHAEQYGDCGVIYSDLCRAHGGEIDATILDKADHRAWMRFRREWGKMLSEPNKDEVDELIWSLGG